MTRPSVPAAERLEGLQVEELAGGLRLFVARRWPERRKGLARLSELPSGWALKITPCNAIHTFGMRFALDVVWLDRRDRVLRVDQDVRPRRQRICLRARSVVETRAGEGEGFAEALQRKR